MPSPLILPGTPGTPAAPDPTDQGIAICDRCGCLVAVAYLAAHDRACGGTR